MHCSIVTLIELSFFLNFKILTNQYFSKKAASYLETEVILNVV